MHVPIINRNTLDMGTEYRPGLEIVKNQTRYLSGALASRGAMGSSPRAASVRS